MGVDWARAFGTTPLAPLPLPPPVAAKEGIAELPDTRLWYWDTGGEGEPIVLVHPSSGSGLVWGYQQPVLAKLGYRVIGYSRRGYFGSDALVPGREGTGAEDLAHLTDILRLKSFHLVASAAGGTIAADYALWRPETLISLTISSNPAGIRRGYIADAIDRLRPKDYHKLPRPFREVGPSYRAANPEGTKIWIGLEQKGAAEFGLRQNVIRSIEPEDLGTLSMPTLLIAGTADFGATPSIMRMVAKHIPDCRLAVVNEAGHSVYWERPDVFNSILAGFIAGATGRHLDTQGDSINGK
jgi:pimeloyl-ACP methyl ester carboxylesterase